MNDIGPIDAIKHKDARVNIPTQELRGFVETDEAALPQRLCLRDPSPDPELCGRVRRPGLFRPDLTCHPGRV